MVDKLRNFISHANMLKVIPRSGWITHGVALQEIESVAEHAFSTTTFAMLVADLERESGRVVDVERVLRMALLHDLAEALTFDISKSYLQYIGKRGESIKEELESTAWSHLTGGLRPGSIGRHYARLQSEFNRENTLESEIVHAADKLDILFQIIDYGRRGYSKEMFDDLWDSTYRLLKAIKLPSVQRLRKLAMDLHSSSR